jgi:predicted metal-dependent enzyme (double-stranded beta helix superfamily)
MVATYGLAALTNDLDALVADPARDQRAIVAAAKPLLARLLQDMRWLDRRYTAPRGKSVQYLLHRHPGDRYSVVAVVFDVGYCTSVHNHGTWGLVGVWHGEEQEDRFKRSDDPTRPGEMRLRAAGSVVNTPGSVTHLIAPAEDIHRIRNLSPHPSLSIHVYGGDLDGKLREQYDLETGAIKEFRTSVVVLE